MSKGKTAILFFSRTLNDEFEAKPIGSKQRFKSLYQFFVNRTLQTARSSRLPVVEIYSNQQNGDSFGERLVNSLETVKSKGYSQVIVIGNDTPELSVDDLQTASLLIGKGKSVLGKDKRGGTYLIGLDLTRGFDFLKQVKWNSNTVYSQLKSKLKGAYDLSLKKDVNKLEDIKSLIRSKDLQKGVVVFLMSNFEGDQLPYLNNIRHKQIVIAGIEDRGPPTVAA